MKELLHDSLFFGIFISLFAYEAGVFCKRKWKLAIFHPLLIAIVFVIAVLLAFGIDYETYLTGARHLSFLLTPATVSLAVLLYEKLQPLKKNWKAIFAGIFAGALTNAVCVLVCAVLFGFTHEQYVTMLPKSITTAIGMALSKEMGGVSSITVGAIVITGVLGNMFAEEILRLFRITEPEAKGIGMGTAAHAMGTAKAMELGETEGAASGLSIAVSGVFTVVIALIFSKFY